MKGDENAFFRISDQLAFLRPRFAIAIAQPGVTKAGVSKAQRELLGATEVYLRETATSTFEVYCSP